MTCQRCQRLPAVARVVSYDGRDRVMDVAICHECLYEARELGLQELPLEVQDEK